GRHSGSYRPRLLPGKINMDRKSPCKFRANLPSRAEQDEDAARGQLVLRLDDTVTRANLGVVHSQLDELMAREARLLAERDEADAIAFPGQLAARRTDASVANALAGQA